VVSRRFVISLGSMKHTVPWKTNKERLEELFGRLWQSVHVYMTYDQVSDGSQPPMTLIFYSERMGWFSFSQTSPKLDKS
jgi:hypothetical protein